MSKREKCLANRSNIRDTFRIPGTPHPTPQHTLLAEFSPRIQLHSAVHAIEHTTKSQVKKLLTFAFRISIHIRFESPASCHVMSLWPIMNLQKMSSFFLLLLSSIFVFVLFAFQSVPSVQRSSFSFNNMKATLEQNDRFLLVHCSSLIPLHNAAICIH